MYFVILFFSKLCNGIMKIFDFERKKKHPPCQYQKEIDASGMIPIEQCIESIFT